MKNPIKFATTFLFASALALLSGSDAKSDGTANTIAGVQSIYGNISADQVEFISTPERIKAVTATGSMTAIWETLEHGERVDCLECIPMVQPLLYDANPRTREIAAWWLRRRIFGVFGPNEVYQQNLNTLASDPDPNRRAYAASAVGEFLSTAGSSNLATAATKDADGGVRAAALNALTRLNDDASATITTPGGAISAAMSDPDPRVKLAALNAAGRVRTYNDPTSVAKLATDADPNVRRRTMEVLGSLHAKASVQSILSVAKSDADPRVRAAACHTLGRIGDASVRGDLMTISTNDTDVFVRDMAQVALRRL